MLFCYINTVRIGQCDAKCKQDGTINTIGTIVENIAIGLDRFLATD